MKKVLSLLGFLGLNSAVLAQVATTTGAPAQQASFTSMLMPFAIIMVIFYFLMIRPQKKKLEEEQKFLSALKKGDEVYTRGGMMGIIYGLTDKVVTLEVAENMRIKILRSQIVGDTQTLLKPAVKAPVVQQANEVKK